MAPFLSSSTFENYIRKYKNVIKIPSLGVQIRWLSRSQLWKFEWSEKLYQRSSQSIHMYGGFYIHSFSARNPQHFDIFWMLLVLEKTFSLRSRKKCCSWHYCTIWQTEPSTKCLKKRRWRRKKCNGSFFISSPFVTAWHTNVRGVHDKDDDIRWC